MEKEKPFDLMTIGNKYSYFFPLLARSITSTTFNATKLTIFSSFAHNVYVSVHLCEHTYGLKKNCWDSWIGKDLGILTGMNL